MQPYLFPYIGYFQLINAVDKFVIYDDVNFIKGGWVNRNNLLVNNQKHLFTITLYQSGSFKHINEITIKDDFSKFIKNVYFSYNKAPFFKQANELILEILSYNERNLGKFITNSLIAISGYLGIETYFIVSSELLKDNSLKNYKKVIHICNLLNAETYINSIGGQCLYNREDFAFHNIELKFLKSRNILYDQFNNEFVPWLSVIDVMMFNSKEKIKEMLTQYEIL